MFIGRRQDGSIYGAWRERQPEDADHPNMEEVSDDHPDLVAFLAPKPPDPRIVKDEQERQEAKVDAQIQADLNMTPAEVNSAVDTLFAAWTAPQRTFMKRLVRMVLAAARKVLR